MCENIGLYRGKRKDNGEWVEGFLVPITVNCYDKGYEIIEKDGIEYDEFDYYHPSFCSDRVVPETVGQYTGLRDCKRTKEYPEGQMIFEGDIMETAVCGLKHHIGVVQFVDGSFGLRCTDGDAFFLCFVAGNYMVIGNVSDNPELLEQKQ